MNTGKTVFAQLMEHFSRYDFDKCVERYRANHRVQSFSCLDQFFCLAYNNTESANDDDNDDAA